jgi:hypothetical protein
LGNPATKAKAGRPAPKATNPTKDLVAVKDMLVVVLKEIGYYDHHKINKEKMEKQVKQGSGFAFLLGFGCENPQSR